MLGSHPPCLEVRKTFSKKDIHNPVPPPRVDSRIKYPLTASDSRRREMEVFLPPEEAPSAAGTRAVVLPARLSILAA